MTARRILSRLAYCLATMAVIADIASADAPQPSLATRATRFAKVTSATADFVQEREVSLVDEVLHARGTLALAAPASFRLDLTAPEPMTLVVAGAAMTVVDASGKVMPVPAEFTGLAAVSKCTPEADRRCFALGTVRYPEGWEGSILYLKPLLLPTVPTDVRHYAETNAAFPHESTSDQFFNVLSA